METSTKQEREKICIALHISADLKYSTQGGKPTVEVELITDDGHRAVASVPSGTSRGKYEAHELYDEDKKRFRGFGVRKAVNNVNTLIRDELVGMDVCDQAGIDQRMMDLDGTPDKHRLGANAILGRIGSGEQGVRAGAGQTAL